MAAATQQQPRTTTRTQEVPQSAADMEAVLIQTEKDLAALRDKIDAAHPGLACAAATSVALQRVRLLVNKDFIGKYVMPLMNSPLGFMTDKTGAKGQDDFYRPEQLIEPVAEALIRGFNIAGNEMNIISGRFYGAQNGYRRLVREIPGLTDLEEIPGTPTVNNGNTVVRFIIRCKIGGQPWVLKNDKSDGTGRVFTIRVNQGMGPDAVLGKAARKALKAAYEEITGTKITESDEPEPKEGATTAEIPIGRSKLKDIQGGNGDKTAAPAPNNQTFADEAAPEKPAPGDASEVPDDQNADQLAMQIQDAIDGAADAVESREVGRQLNEAKGRLGDVTYGALLGMLQARNRELGVK